MDSEYLNSTIENLDNSEARKDYPEARFVVADLTQETVKIIALPKKITNTYVSGPALGMRIWAQQLSDSDDNPLVFVCSQVSQNLTIVFRSPQNGRILSHSIKSSIADSLKSLGFTGLIFTGRARRYSNIEISGEGLNVILTEQFTHLKTSEIAALFNSSETNVLVTGPGCEVGIPFSCAVIDGVSTGRGGLGLVLEEKNIRVISVVKTGSDKDLNQKRDCLKELSFVDKAAERGWAPVNNYSDRTDPRLFHLSVSEVSRKKGTYPQDIPPYESLLMLGPNTGCFDIDTIINRYRYCIDMGLDPISTGNVLSQMNAGNSDIKELLDSVCFEGKKLQASSMSINGLECGGVDYRGAFATGLNEALGNNFPVSFDLEFGCCEKDPAMWVMFNEIITLGLESLGYSSDIIPSLYNSLSPFKKAIVKRFPERLETILDNQILKEKGITAGEVIEKGRLCVELRDKINVAGKCGKPVLPDFFCVDPRSNCRSDSIVPLFSLVQRYFHLRNNFVFKSVKNLHKS